MLTKAPTDLIARVHLKGICAVLKKETGLNYLVREHQDCQLIDIFYENRHVEQSSDPVRLQDFLCGMIEAYRTIQQLQFIPVLPATSKNKTTPTGE